MKKRFGLLIIALAVIASLFLPGLSIYVHSQLGAETAALFPASVSTWQMAVHGVNCLPVDAVSALGVISFSGWLALGAALLLACSAVLSLSANRKLNGLSFESFLGILLAGLCFFLAYRLGEFEKNQ